MLKKVSVWLVFFIIVALALTGCTTSPATIQPTIVPTQTEPTVAPSQPAAGPVALKITGLVDKEMAWSEAEVKAMETMSVESTNKSGQTATYTGVDINKLLALAGIKPEATKVVFVADDGYTAEIALTDLKACTNCIVSFRDKGGFSTVLPDFPGSLQVKGVIEIQVQ